MSHITKTNRRLRGECADGCGKQSRFYRCGDCRAVARLKREAAKDAKLGTTHEQRVMRMPAVLRRFYERGDST